MHGGNQAADPVAAALPPTPEPQLSPTTECARAAEAQPRHTASAEVPEAPLQRSMYRNDRGRLNPLEGGMI